MGTNYNNIDNFGYQDREPEREIDVSRLYPYYWPWCLVY